MTLIEAAVNRSKRISWRVICGLGLGMSGVGVLLGPTSRELYQVDPVGAAVIVAAALSWSLGSLWSRKANLPSSPAMTVATQMMTAGAVLLFLSGILGEWHTAGLGWSLSNRSIIAVLYLSE